MRRAAGFHGHIARLQRLSPAHEAGAAQHFAFDHRAARIDHADGEHILGQVDGDGSTLVHDFPCCLRLMIQHLNRGTSMPCDFTVASGRGSPSYSLEPPRYSRRR